MDPQLWPEGSYELGSVSPSILSSFLLSGCFLEIDILVFFLKLSMVVGPCGVMHERAGIFEKNIFVPKMGKMDQKWARITVFLNLLEILDIVFFEICSIRKVCKFAVFLHKSHILEKSGF